MTGTLQTTYKLSQEVAGYQGAIEEFSQLMWEQFQQSTNFKKIVGDLEDAFSKVNVFIIHFKQ